MGAVQAMRAGGKADWAVSSEGTRCAPHVGVGVFAAWRGRSLAGQGPLLLLGHILALPLGWPDSLAWWTGLVGLGLDLDLGLKNGLELGKVGPKINPTKMGLRFGPWA